MGKLLATFQKRPGFDNKPLKQAIGSTSVERLVCWQRGVPPDGAGDDRSE